MSDNSNKSTITITIDTREPEHIMQEFITHIQKISKIHGITITPRFGKLDSGDFCIDGEVFLERKTWNDLAASIKDGRCKTQWEKLSHLIDMAYRVYWIIEGEPPKIDKTINGVNTNAVYGKLYRMLSRDWQIIYTRDSNHTVYSICHLARQFYEWKRLSGFANPTQRWLYRLQKSLPSTLTPELRQDLDSLFSKHLLISQDSMTDPQNLFNYLSINSDKNLPNSGESPRILPLIDLDKFEIPRICEPEINKPMTTGVNKSITAPEINNLRVLMTEPEDTLSHDDRFPEDVSEMWEVIFGKSKLKYVAMSTHTIRDLLITPELINSLKLGTGRSIKKKTRDTIMNKLRDTNTILSGLLAAVPRASSTLAEFLVTEITAPKLLVLTLDEAKKMKITRNGRLIAKTILPRFVACLDYKSWEYDTDISRLLFPQKST